MLQTLEMPRKYRSKEIVSGTRSVVALNIEDILNMSLRCASLV